MPTSGRPSPSKSAIVGAPPMFVSFPQFGFAGSGIGFSRIPPVQAEVLEPARADADLLASAAARRAAVRAVRRLARDPHADAEESAAGVSGRRAGVLLQLVGVVPGDDLGNAVQVDVGDGAEGPDAVATDLIAAAGSARLRAERLARRGVVDAVADHHLRALRV